MVKFLHCADVHLDSPLRSLSNYPGAPVELLRTATRDAFEGLIDVAIRETVDFIIIAGDLYDGPWRDFRTGLFFVNQMGRLRENNIPAYVLYGNHDAESQITKSLPLPDNVNVFPARKPKTFKLDTLNVAIHGQSFAEPAITDNLAAGYPANITNHLNIGVLHTALEGNAVHAPYAPCSVAELEAKGYQYWALGHVHQYAAIAENPHIIFPGNVQGRNIREAGAKGAVLVTAEDDRIVEVERVFTDVVRWAEVTIEAGTAETIGDAIRIARRAIEENVEETAEGRVLAVRTIFQGRTPIHGQMIRQSDQLVAEVRSIGAELGGDKVWVEKVKIQTEPPHDIADIKEREDALGELAALIANDQIHYELLTELRKAFEPLNNKIHSPLKGEIEDAVLLAVLNGDFADVIEQAGSNLVARLGVIEEAK